MKGDEPRSTQERREPAAATLRCAIDGARARGASLHAVQIAAVPRACGDSANADAKAIERPRSLINYRLHA
jgi:hypothetical protein